MDWFRARQQFNADMADGSQRTVHINEVLPASHELVKRDLDGATAAVKAGIDRDALFEPLDSGEEEPAPPPKSTAKAPARAGKAAP
jgi:hypothetical protein